MPPWRIVIIITLICFTLSVACAPAPYRVTNYFKDPCLTTLAIKRVAVLPFDNWSEWPEAAKKVTEEFNLQVGKLGRFELVERIRIQELYKEQDFDPKRVDETTAVRIGKMLGAQGVILGSVTRYKPSKEMLEKNPEQYGPPAVIVTGEDTERKNFVAATLILVAGILIWILSTILMQRRTEAEVGISARLVEVETGRQIWQAKDTFSGKNRAIQALVASSERERLKLDVDYLAQILCQELVRTID